MDGAECVIDALLETKMTGRCEVFSAEQFTIPGRFFTVGAAVRLRGKKNTPGYQKWKKIVARVAELSERFNGRITLHQQMSELSEKRAMKEWLLYCGAAEIRDGEISKVLDTDDDGNFIDSYLRRKETEPI